MLTVLTLLKLKPSPNGALHGERPFWREFGEQYLRAWLAGVRKYVPGPKNILVMTDSERHIATQVGEFGEEYYPIGRIVDAPGFWAKLEMFRYAPGGKCLWLDLDNVLCGDLSALCALSPDPLIMMDDRHIPGLPNGSTMLFDAERCRGIWDDYALAPRTFEKYHVVNGDDYTHAFDQAYIAEWLRGSGHEVSFFQEMLPLGYALNAYSELPQSDDWRSAHLIFGCGPAKPHAVKHQVFRENWLSV
jgi:hypothetical protein